MQGPPRLSNEEIDALLEVSLKFSGDDEEYYQGHLYATNHCRPMIQMLSVDPGYDDNPEDYWSPDVAYWFADGRPCPWNPIDDPDLEELCGLVEEPMVQ